MIARSILASKRSAAYSRLTVTSDGFTDPVPLMAGRRVTCGLTIGKVSSWPSC